MSVPNPRSVEEAALRAWPASRQEIVSGWIVRVSDGYTKRANSATLLYPVEDSFAPQTIRSIAAMYRARELPAILRLPSLTAAAFDDALGRMGHPRLDPTVVMTKQVPGSSPRDDRVRSLDLDEGLAVHARMHHMSDRDLRRHRAIIERIDTQASFFGLVDGSKIVACGLAVIDGRFVGLFDIVTDQEHRRKGYASRLMRGMMNTARSCGASIAYLQVIEENRPARTLYLRLGFQESYRYAYRLLDPAIDLPS